MFCFHQQGFFVNQFQLPLALANGKRDYNISQDFSPQYFPIYIPLLSYLIPLEKRLSHDVAPDF